MREEHRRRVIILGWRARLARRREKVARERGIHMISETNPPIWSRWHILSKVSPSGKTLFICLVCGREDVAPRRECSGVPRINARSPVATSIPVERTRCHEIEEDINIERIRRFDPIRQLYLAEMKLKGLKLCEFCMGWGCNVCGGIGGK